MSVTDSELERMAADLGAALLARGWHVACAESCTGGWIAKTLTDIPGSSAWFGWGLVAYANDAKLGLLDIPTAVLDTHGAVSEPVVRAMADGVKQRSGAELAVSVSGIVGPDGGSANKPVGTVWFAWSGPAGIQAQMHRFQGDRELVRRESVARALQGLQTLLTDS